MYEVEVKARLKNREEIKKKLEGMGCVFSEELHQVDHIFIPPDLPFPPPFETPVLRVRKENDQNILTLKISQSGRQDSIERELEIKDSEMMIEILRLMKWFQCPVVDKRRIKTKFRDMEIVLDTVESLGQLIEAEKITTDADPEARKKVQEELCNFLQSVGIPKEDLLVNYKYDIMLEEKMGMR